MDTLEDFERDIDPELLLDKKLVELQTRSQGQIQEPSSEARTLLGHYKPLNIAVQLIPITRAEAEAQQMPHLQEELVLLKALRHDNIAACFGCFVDRGRSIAPSRVVEHAHRGTLADMLKRHFSPHCHELGGTFGLRTSHFEVLRAKCCFPSGPNTHAFADH